MNRFLFFVLFLILIKPAIAANKDATTSPILIVVTENADTIRINSTGEEVTTSKQHQLTNKKKSTENKKLVSAILAFPFPFGLFGGHRIYLGTSPIVPIVYIATLGGCFGILPFIDFVVILVSKDVNEYTNNPKIFMWVK